MKKIWKNYRPTKGDIIKLRLFNGIKVCGYYAFQNLQYYFLLCNNYKRNIYKVTRNSIQSAKTISRTTWK